MMRFSAFLLASLVAAGSYAQNLSNFEKFLIPVVTSPPIEGANGDRFSAGVMARLPGPEVRLFPVYRSSGAPPEIGTPVGVPAGSPFRVLFDPSASRSGRLLFIERGTPRVTLHANVVTLNPTVPGELSSITTQPIVRESDFKSDSTFIIGLVSRYVIGPNPCPNTATPVFRHMLRIYDVDGGIGSQVRVRQFDSQLDFVGPLSDKIVTIDRRDGTDPSYPSYAELVLVENCRPFSCHTPCGGGSFHVEVAPLTSGLRFWAMVSATNNFTHQVTLYYPQ